MYEHFDNRNQAAASIIAAGNCAKSQSYQSLALNMRLNLPPNLEYSDWSVW